MSPSPLVYATSDPDAPPPHSKLGRAACLLIVPGCLGYAGHYVIVTLDLRSPIANAFLEARIDQLTAEASAGFSRGRVKKPKPRRSAS